MDITQIEGLISSIQNMQSIMIAVATRDAQIQEAEASYIELFEEVDLDIELLQEDGLSIANPNPFKSLWDWYGYWSSDLANYASRRRYVYDLYVDLINILEQCVQDKSCQPTTNSSIAWESFAVEKLEEYLAKIQDLQEIMIAVATAASSIQEEESNYIDLYREISSYIHRLQQSGLAAKNPNNFGSLWHWHSYWKTELDGHASRRSFVRNLYESVTIPIQKALRKHRQKSTSIEEFLEDLQLRFNEQVSTEQIETVMLDSTKVTPIVNSSANFQSVTNEASVNLPPAELRSSALYVSSPAVELKIDFAIVTAIKAERLAVLKCLEIDEANDRFPIEHRTYWRKRLCLKDGKFYEIVVAQSLDTANLQAGFLTNDMLHHWKPHSVLMVGIAAAANPKQTLGDLVVGREVYYYEMGKVIAEGKIPEPKQIPADSTLLDRAQALPNTPFPILVDRPDETTAFPSIEFGVIASGDKVISAESERDKIASVNRKIMAIEMEGYGVTSAAWNSFERVRCLVIRSLCDYADNKKDDQWQEYAAAVAASYTKHLLLDEPLPPSNSPELS
jgi:nucleoside phosphorylase